MQHVWLVVNQETGLIVEVWQRDPDQSGRLAQQIRHNYGIVETDVPVAQIGILIGKPIDAIIQSQSV